MSRELRAVKGRVFYASEESEIATLAGEWLARNDCAEGSPSGRTGVTAYEQRCELPAPMLRITSPK